VVSGVLFALLEIMVILLASSYFKRGTVYFILKTLQGSYTSESGSIKNTAWRGIYGLREN
jgi:hypothetical protein